MGSTHDKVNEKAVEEHGFFKASIVQQFVLLYESNPLSMLPPPLNLLLLPCLPFHYYTRNEGRCTSVCGTASNVMLWLLFVVPKSIVLALNCWIGFVVYIVRERKAPALLRGRDEERDSIWEKCLAAVVVIFGLP